MSTFGPLILKGFLKMMYTLKNRQRIYLKSHRSVTHSVLVWVVFYLFYNNFFLSYFLCFNFIPISYIPFCWNNGYCENSFFSKDSFRTCPQVFQFNLF